MPLGVQAHWLLQKVVVTGAVAGLQHVASRVSTKPVPWALHLRVMHPTRLSVFGTHTHTGGTRLWLMLV